MNKTAENHTLWGRTYLYSPYKEVLPRAVVSDTERLYDFETRFKIYSNCILG